MKERLAVPKAEFRSYYGRQILKTPVWNWMIAAYLFTGGLSAGSALLAAGADLTGRPQLRRVSRLGALVSLLASMYFLIGDLGRPERFHHMLRVAKPSSPMSMGTWILGAYGPGAGVAAIAELMPKRLRRTWIGGLVDWVARPAGLEAAAVAPGVASYTAVLLSHTAVPAWHEAHPYLPFVFTGSASSEPVTTATAFASSAQRSRAAGRLCPPPQSASGGTTLVRSPSTSTSRMVSVLLRRMSSQASGVWKAMCGVMTSLPVSHSSRAR